MADSKKAVKHPRPVPQNRKYRNVVAKVDSRWVFEPTTPAVPTANRDIARGKPNPPHADRFGPVHGNVNFR